MMNEEQPTTRQLIVFTVILSFVVSIIGTVLSLGVLGPLFSTGETASSPFFFNRPAKILERISETIIPENHIIRQDEQVVKAVEQANPAVVSVVATKDVPVIEKYFIDPFGEDPMFKQFFGGDSGFRIPQFRQNGTQKQEVSSGSGFFVSADGLVVTNKHVVADKGASYTILMNNGQKLSAAVVARDPIQDIAILKVEGSGFAYLRLGNSSDVKIGQTVIAIGNALGEFRNTVSVGVVSGLQRSLVANGGLDGPENLDDLIQTDAAINPGNSGGPLLNLSGEVIGINTAIARGAENIGFSLPVDRVKRDLASVQQSGRIIYPFLGVRFTAVTSELAQKEKLGRDFGALLKGSSGEPAVTKDGPADKAGLKEGDIILKINGDEIKGEQTLSSLIQKYQVGSEITLRVFRDGKEFEVKVVLEEKK